ncbi:unnamed protein product, partial [Dibothriocephalus latus]
MPGGNNFVFSVPAVSPVESVEIDGKKIPKAPAGKPLEPSKDTWQEIKKPNYLTVSGPLKAPHASMSVQPAPKVGGDPLIFVYKKPNAPTPTFPNAVKPQYVQEVPENEEINHDIVFTTKP